MQKVMGAANKGNPLSNIAMPRKSLDNINKK